MTGITDEQRSNYSMMNVSYTNLVFLIDFFVKLAPTHKIFLQALSEWTRMAPQKRIESINKFATRMTGTKAVKDEFTKWGMELNPSIKTLQGRLLNPEKVFLKREFQYNSNNADWGHSKFSLHIISV